MRINRPPRPVKLCTWCQATSVCILQARTHQDSGVDREAWSPWYQEGGCGRQRHLSRRLLAIPALHSAPASRPHHTHELQNHVLVRPPFLPRPPIVWVPDAAYKSSATPASGNTSIVLILAHHLPLTANRASSFH
jgi:hypothetical protein